MKCKRFAAVWAGIAVAVLIAGAAIQAACAQSQSDLLLSPTSEMLNQQAPAVFTARLETTKGDILIEVHREWAPRGADRFYNLVQHGFYAECRFFRVVADFMAQIGIHGNPAVTRAWMRANLLDDPVQQSNTRGFVTYAKSPAPNSRTTQIFINVVDNSSLDREGFAPFGRIVQGMEVVDALYAGYGEAAPRGSGPDQMQLMLQGNAYLAEGFPKLDYVKACSILSAGPHAPEP
jgi:peptidyl-prolyl cis-trans isomerase A (cyclophilin A)